MGSSLFVFLFSSLLLFQVSSRAVNISTSWTLPQEGFPHFFRYFQHPATWDDAKAVCSSFNAELFTVETDERRDAARAYLKELDVLDNVWCGLERVNNQAPFVWTGGGQGPVVGDAYWQEAYPLDPERLCVAIEPLQDYRWQSYPCNGPQISPFVCQLQVPDWATGPEGCLVNSLPSLTVTYLSETEIVELLSDCGLSGTKRIACKGGENQEDLIKRLSCDPLEDNHLFTRDWSTKPIRKWSTSTPSNAINGFTYQMTHSSNTRHKRESGATSPSTDILLQTEASHPLNNSPEKTSKVPNLQTENPLLITTAAEILSVKEDIKEITGIPDVFQTTIGSPLDRGSTHQLSVKNWLQTHDSQLASTINTILPIIQVTASESITYTPRVPQEVTTMAAVKTDLEKTTLLPRMKDLPPTLIQQKMYKKIEKTIDAEEDQQKEAINQVLDVNIGDTDPIQIREGIESLVEGAPVFKKKSKGSPESKNKIMKPGEVKRISGSSPATENPVNKEKPASLPPVYQEKRLEKIIVETSTDSLLKIDPTSEQPIKIIPPKLIEAVPTLDRPITEVMSKVNTEISTEKKTTSEHKNTEAPIQTTVVGGLEEIELKKMVDPKTENNPPIIRLNVNEELKVSTQTDEKVSTVAPIQTASEKLEEIEDKEKLESTSTIAPIKSTTVPIIIRSETSTTNPTTVRSETSTTNPTTVKSETSTTVQSIPSSPLTSTYWPKIESPSSTTISTKQPISEHSIPTETFKINTDNIEISITKSLQKDTTLRDTIISSLSPIKDSSAQEPSTLPKITTSPLPIQTSTPKTVTSKPEESNIDRFQEKSTTFRPDVPKQPEEVLTPVRDAEDNLEVIELNPIAEEGATVLEIHPDVEILSNDGIKPIVLMKSVFPQDGIKENQENVDVEEGTTEIAFSDESSEEAENPKRTARGRLFPHSNPLSFYPYFLNRVLG